MARGGAVTCELGSSAQGTLKHSQQLTKATQVSFRKRGRLPGTVLKTIINALSPCPASPGARGLSAVVTVVAKSVCPTH